MNRYHSPCTGVCTLNKDDVCVGCGRTREEILDWVQKAAEERRRIMARSRERLARLGAAPSAPGSAKGPRD